MPWWFWVLLWTALVVVSGGILAALGWKTGKKIFDCGVHISLMGEEMTARWDRGASSVAQRIRKAPVPGVLVPVRVAREEFVRERMARSQRKIARRIKRRDRLGQPQRIGDLRSGAQKGKTHG